MITRFSSTCDLGSASQCVDVTPFILDRAVLQWMSISCLSCAVASSRRVLAEGDACWKGFALQLYPELQMRRADAEWRNCLLRKLRVPRETPDTCMRALLDRGENVWKFQNVWHTCRCGALHFIGECGKAMETSRCIECGLPVGGRDHRLVSSNVGLSHEDAGLAAAALRTSTSNMQVTLRRLSGEIWTTMHVPKDCTAQEAKWRTSRQLDVPVPQLSLAHGEQVLQDDSALSTFLGESTSLDITVIVTAS